MSVSVGWSQIMYVYSTYRHLKSVNKLRWSRDSDCYFLKQLSNYYTYMVYYRYLSFSRKDNICPLNIKCIFNCFLKSLLKLISMNYFDCSVNSIFSKRTVAFYANDWWAPIYYLQETAIMCVTDVKVFENDETVRNARVVSLIRNAAYSMCKMADFSNFMCLQDSQLVSACLIAMLALQNFHF